MTFWVRKEKKLIVLCEHKLSVVRSSECRQYILFLSLGSKKQTLNYWDISSALVRNLNIIDAAAGTLSCDKLSVAEMEKISIHMNEVEVESWLCDPF